ncbi:hypothetical protein HY993_02050 [Candidatus Micrarchaeota archaeon]|nr:hypothetical protein [Candidatus Micrarchaeota archaeon]
MPTYIANNITEQSNASINLSTEGGDPWKTGYSRNLSIRINAEPAQKAKIFLVKQSSSLPIQTSELIFSGVVPNSGILTLQLPLNEQKFYYPAIDDDAYSFRAVLNLLQANISSNELKTIIASFSVATENVTSQCAEGVCVYTNKTSFNLSKEDIVVTIENKLNKTLYLDGSCDSLFDVYELIASEWRISFHAGCGPQTVGAFDIVAAIPPSKKADMLVSRNILENIYANLALKAKFSFFGRVCYAGDNPPQCSRISIPISNEVDLFS